MSDALRRMHETWLGMAQPIEGLVFSATVLADKGVGRPDEGPAQLQKRFLALCPPSAIVDGRDARPRIADLPAFLEELLGLTPDLFHAGDALPAALRLDVPEADQLLRPTLALRKQQPVGLPEGTDATEAAKAGAAYELLLWDLAEHDAAGLDLDAPEAVTGHWRYPPTAKFDRLLRHVRVPLGLLTNREELRLVYAPHGESTGHLTFRLKDMAEVGGRPILDAFVSLLSAHRFFGGLEDATPRALLEESRKRQANVTNELASQVFDALQVLLAAFQAAAERDPERFGQVFADALEREDDHIYRGLLTVMLRLVFLLFAEDRGLLPVEHPTYAEHLSVLGLYERLQEDAGAHPDSMSQRYGAWGQLLVLFRAVFTGVDHGELHMPPRRGDLFDPHRYPFLEGVAAGASPLDQPELQAEVAVPTIDDGAVYAVLERLVVFEGHRLSYKALDVEQIGSVYEALMGYHVERMEAPAVRTKSGQWLTVEQILEVKPAQRAKWLKTEAGLTTAQAKQLAEAFSPARESPPPPARGRGPGGGPTSTALDALLDHAARTKDKTTILAKPGQLVLQPGAERRRTSSHYTPRSLSEPIVRRTLEPLLACMGDAPSSERILELKICDPAMGSGAFLVEACRYLADQLVAAWTREGKLEDEAKRAPGEDPVLHARRLVAQRCLYGVDKNAAAVELAKLSLWLVTLRDLPFTFVDHALRHGDSLVGLSFDQIRAFHWKPSKQLELADRVLREALDEAIDIRKQIHALAADPTPEAQRLKETLVKDAEDASDRARLIGDVVVGAFFAEAKDKAREKERTRRLTLVQRWLDGDEAAHAELRQHQADLRARLPVFHWMLEYPEVFYAERPDPLEDGKVNRAAFMDAFIGNPPFLGGTRISVASGTEYRDWLATRYEASSLTDLSAFFFRAAFELLGAHGTLGLIATNTIAQGDSRKTGLGWIRASAGWIYDATSRRPWPGEASVSVSVVHAARGRIRPAPQLDGRSVRRITAFLSDVGGDQDPETLAPNKDVAVIGSFVLGIGFVFDDGNAEANPLAEMHALIERDPRNGERIAGYLGGEELNTTPDQRPRRYIIDFGEASESEARNWPELFAIVERRVKPARASVKQRDRRDLWWLHATRSPQQRAFVADQGRCLALSQVSSHLALAFIEPGIVAAHTVVLILLSTATGFAVLQSRIHERWARLLSSSLEERLRYTPTTCFETFPFPEPDPRAVIATLEDIGERVYESRAAYMLETQQGLTQTYNRLKAPACHDEPMLELRRLHEEMDRAVLAAYGWTDLEVPPYCPTTHAERQALETFHDELIDRLFVLNAARAAAETGHSHTRRTGSPPGSAPRRKTKRPAQEGLDFDE